MVREELFDMRGLRGSQEIYPAIDLTGLEIGKG